MKHETSSEERILVVDDEESAITTIEMALYTEGIENVVKCSDSRKVMGLLEAENIGVVLLDLMMPHLRGEELLGMITEAFPDIVIIIVAAFNEIEKAVDCIKTGAFDYIAKPVNRKSLCDAVCRAVDARLLRTEKARYEQRVRLAELRNPDAFSRIVTASPEMMRIFHYIEAIASGSKCVTVTGETGVGKELIVEAIHKASGRTGELVAVNVSALDETAFSDTLFGHRKGAFTGAVVPRKGLIERAAGGTLFLDEIGDISANAQVKLLRLLQEAEYFPLGSDVAETTDARIVVATNVSVDTLEKGSQFRRDLFFRLMGHHIHVPPLRERLESDLVLLVKHLVDKQCSELRKAKPDIGPDILRLLGSYDYPGNIRELEAMLFDAISREHNGKVPLDNIRHNVLRSISFENSECDGSSRFDSGEVLPTLKEATELLIEKAMDRTGGNQAAAARILGISSQALNQRLRRHDKKRSDGRLDKRT